MKKITSIVFGFILLSSIFLNFKEVRADAPSISIGSANVSVGDDISIPITVSNAVDVKTISLTIIYNGNLLTYTGYTQNYATPLGTGTISVTTGTGGTGLKVMPVWTSDSPLNGDLVPITLNFKVKTPRTVNVPSTIQFGGPASSFIYLDGDLVTNVASTFTFSNGQITSTLNSIAVLTPANKLSYYVGDPLDITGMVIKGTYADNSTQNQTITASNISGFNSSVPAVGQILTVTVGGKTTTYTVNILEVPVTLSSIAISTPANKLLYYVGDTLDIAGLEITGTYSNSSTSIQTITTDNITGFNSLSPATGQVLTVTIEDKTTTYTIDILAKPIIEIEPISVLPGEEISIPINLIDVIDVKSFSFNLPYNSNLLTYTGYTANYPTTGTTVVSTPVVSGQGLKITVTWTADSSLTGNLVPVTLNFTVSSPISVTLPYALAFGGLSGNSIKDISNVEIKNNFTFSNGTISATPIILSSLAITHGADKLSYYIGDSLNIEGLEVTGTYNDNSTSIQTITTDNITGFDSRNIITDQVLTVTVGGINTTYTVDIKRRSSSGGGGGGGNSTIKNIIPEIVSNNCLLGDLFNRETGQRCTVSTTTTITSPSLAPYSESESIPSRVLKQGMQGDDVKALQVYLNTHGYLISLTGAGSLNNETNYFGSKTKQMVIKFQLANGLVGDGVVGKMTRKKMK